MQAVYLVQPNYHAIFNEKVNYWLPYSIGTIWCYANQNKIIQDNFNLKDIFFKRSIINDVVEQVSTTQFLHLVIMCGIGNIIIL